MKKIGFVTPWYGDNISGGAEKMLRETAKNLHRKNIPVEILTTCARDFNSDWNKNFHRSGVTKNKNNIIIRRFKIKKRNTAEFDRINKKFMENIPVPIAEERIFLREMINSTDLYRYMNKYSYEYSLFVFIPYMFGTTYYGLRLFPEKSVLIPCLHDEPYAYMKHFKKIFPECAGIIFNSEPEKTLAEKIYGLQKKGTKTLTAGIGIDTDIKCNADDFRRKFGINQPFILYAGRKDEGKNIYTLINYFLKFIENHRTDLRLVLVGGGSVKIPHESIENQRITDLGFISSRDKYNAMCASEFLCQPSFNESFSLVIMENWLCGRPVLVHGKCDVTRNFVSESNGGLYFENYREFELCTEYFLNNRNSAEIMGKNGKNYVKSRFDKETVTEKYIKFFREIINKNKENLFL
ncbi:MAG: glycosyltransferase family 4 protein [Ruminococcus sp.]|nr:glycosyltransferase family 4 protein [Ruminococcus sp.]